MRDLLTDHFVDLMDMLQDRLDLQTVEVSGTFLIRLLSESNNGQQKMKVGGQRRVSGQLKVG